MTDRRPLDPRMPVEAWLYTQGRGRSVTMQPGPGIRLVREDDALARINALRAALEQIINHTTEKDIHLIAQNAIEVDDHATPSR